LVLHQFGTLKRGIHRILREWKSLRRNETASHWRAIYGPVASSAESIKMNLNKEWRIRLAQILFAGAILIALIVLRGIRAGDEPVHQTTDWSDRHVVFSSPKSQLQSLYLGRNPRYVQQWVRRYAERKDDGRGWRGHHNTLEDLLHGDWNAYMGNVGTVGAGNYPAKYSFNAGTANCASATQPDFVVYNTSLAGSATAVAAFTVGTFSGTPGSGQTFVITNGANSVTLTSSGTTNTGLNWQTSATVATDATNLANAVNRNNGAIAVTATANSPASGQVTITANSAGTAGNNITVTESVTNFSFPFSGTTSNLVNGATGVPTVIAFDNLYAGCTGTVPSTYWAYNTGTTGAVVTSPTLSSDGTQVAFIQSTGTTTAANLVLLKWAASSGTVNAPVTLTAVANANYRTCTAPCMTTIAFGNGKTDLISSPFYDFTTGSDTLYVGDSAGDLHKFTGVFNGTPAEAGAPWPVVAATAPLSSPIYDETSGKVFVTTSFQLSNDSGTRIQAVCATGTACGTVGSTISSGIMGPTAAGANCQGTGASGDTVNLTLDAPILDPSNGTLYAFLGNDGSGNSAVYQFSTTFALHTCGTELTLGTGSTTGVPVYAGDFDNAYYGGGAGHLYVCGNAGGDPTLYQITAPANGVLSAGAGTAGPVLTTAATTCAPVIEVYNPNAVGGAKDWIFTSVQADGATNITIACPTNTGCIMSFDVTSGSTISANTPTVGHTAVAGGASGVVVDNTVGSGTLTGASQVYFTPLATGNCTTSKQQGIGGCAIQASQSALN
jgi:hypothetical protein